MAKIPILEDNEFDLINIQTINTNNRRINTDIKLVARHRDIIYKQEQTCDICEATTPIEDECISNFLNHQTPKCVLKPARQPIRLEEIKKGIILLDTSQQVLISDSCNSSRLVNSPTIIEADNCTIKIMNMTFNSQKHLTNHEEYLIPIYGRRFIQLNYSEEQNEITHIKLEHMNHLEQIKLELRHSKRTTTIGGGILLALIILCSFTVYIINRKTKAMKESVFKIQKSTKPKIEQSRQTQDEAYGFGQLPSLVLFDKSPEDGRQSGRGGVTPQSTSLAGLATLETTIATAAELNARR